MAINEHTRLTIEDKRNIEKWAHELWEEASNHMIRLSEWEEDFVYDVHTRVAHGDSLTVKQIECLREMHYNKIGRG